MPKSREPWEAGAWLSQKHCPQCNATCVFALDFQRLGKHQLRVCSPCGAVFVDGEMMETLIPDTTFDDAA